MCDYSQHGLRSRLAREGELLLTYRFPSGLIGLAAAADIERQQRSAARPPRRPSRWSDLARLIGAGTELSDIPAVCIPDGARLRMSDIPIELRRRWLLRTVEDVQFTRSVDDSQRCLDAIRFWNGQRTLLQALPEGIHFLVLSMGREESFKEFGLFTWPAAVAAFHAL
jgi:hypothetical protein